MPLDLWFPLGVYYADLDAAGEHNASMAATIADLHHQHAAPVPANPDGSQASWTGDVRGVDQLHDDPRFGWLTAQVGTHAWAYLDELGHDLDEVDVHIQRSWPVVTRPGEFVAAHAHHNGHLSCVYYVDAAPDAGPLRFLNTSRANELSPGSSGGASGTFRDANPLNYGSSVYQAVPGRLIMFPSKQRHEVLVNASSSDRLSISFDLVLSTRSDRTSGTHEFLMPPPDRWKRLRRPQRNGASEVRLDQPIPLELISRGLCGEDDLALADPGGHLLMGATVHPDVVSRDQLRRCGHEAPQIHPEGTHFEVLRAGIDRAHQILRSKNISTKGAQILNPRVVGGPGDAQRPNADVCIYVRIDEGEAIAGIDLIETHEVVAIAPGSLAMVGGARRQRVIGAMSGDVPSARYVAFDMTVPSLARAAGPARAYVLGEEVRDVTALHASTALPLGGGYPTLEAIESAVQQSQTRHRRLHRDSQCEVSQKYLVDGADPADATSDEVRQLRRYGATTGQAGADVVETVILGAAACDRLVAHAEAHMTSNVADSVDDHPEYQVNLDVAMLERLVGAASARELLELPSVHGAGVAPELSDVSIFVRLFTSDTRDRLGFHNDIAGYTINVPLECEPVDGGDLVLVGERELRRADRVRGTAVCHDSRLVHGVSRVKNGERWSLIIFFPPLPEPDGAAMNQTSITPEGSTQHVI